jgi:hydrogenase expression/formation protein HypE
MSSATRDTAGSAVGTAAANTLANGITCPVPHAATQYVQLGHGSGGKMSATLVNEHILPRLGNSVLASLGDAAVLEPLAAGARLAISTDGFVVKPLRFPGGSIGHLAVHGTLNDLAMMGARPLALTLGLIIEEGLPMAELDAVLDDIALCTREAGVRVVAGDTKVVERGSADGLFITTTGVGVVHETFAPSANAVQPGDVLIVSGPLAAHGMAIMTAREQLGLDNEIRSDTANLWPLVEQLRLAVGQQVHALRDPTRGGVASTANEIAQASKVGIELEERLLPVPAVVRGACELLGLDPLYVANEGVLCAFVAREYAMQALAVLRAHPLGAHAAIVGRVVPEHPGLVVLRTGIGGRRVVDMLPGEQLPRIC